MKEGLLTPRGWDVVSEREHRIGGSAALCECNMLVLFLLTCGSFCSGDTSINTTLSLLEVVLQEAHSSEWVKGTGVTWGCQLKKKKKNSEGKLLNCTLMCWAVHPSAPSQVF